MSVYFPLCENETECKCICMYARRMHECVCVCHGVCVCQSARACVPVCVEIGTHICMYAFMHCMFVRTYTHVCMHTCAWTARSLNFIYFRGGAASNTRALMPKSRLDMCFRPMSSFSLIIN
jgi:hypothetical protein